MLKAKVNKLGRRITVGEDKAYDTADHVTNLRVINVTPHVAQNDSITSTGKRRRSAIDGRTTRHQGYGIWQSCRAMTENASSAGANSIKTGPGPPPHVAQNDSITSTALMARRLHGQQCHRLCTVMRRPSFLTLALSIVSEARRSAVPVASVTMPATASPCRFSIVAWPM